MTDDLAQHDVARRILDKAGEPKYPLYFASEGVIYRIDSEDGEPVAIEGSDHD